MIDLFSILWNDSKVKPKPVHHECRHLEELMQYESTYIKQLVDIGILSSPNDINKFIINKGQMLRDEYCAKCIDRHSCYR